MLSALKSLLVFSAIAVSASPVRRATIETRDVFVPPITYPTAGVVWPVGSQQIVTWDTSDAPVNITNKFGRIVLRKGAYATNTVLAEGFDILLGQYPVTVPSVDPADDYSLVLFGDSGNWSPEFTISSD